MFGNIFVNNCDNAVKRNLYRETKTINIFVTLDIFALCVYMTLDGVWREIGGVDIFDNVQ